jgi:hypothetical protein
MPTLSFKQILSEKMATPLPTKALPDKSLVGILEPAHLAFLLGTLKVSRSERPSERQAASSRARYPRPPKKPHILNSEQQKALAYFTQIGQKLDPGFTVPELKMAYREMASRFHPDKKGGSQASFVELKINYDRLKSAFSPKYF